MLYVALLQIPMSVWQDLTVDHIDGLCGSLGARLEVGGPVFVALPMPGLPTPLLGE